jgi:hypothetical protein
MNDRCCRFTDVHAESPPARRPRSGGTLRTNKNSKIARTAIRVWQSCFLLAGTIAAIGSHATAAEANVDLRPGPDTKASSAIEELRLSDTLAEFGTRSSDPLALIEAAKLRKTSALEDPRRSQADAEALLARAAEIAGPDPAVASLVEDVRRLKSRDIPVIPLGIKLLHKQIKQSAADRSEVRFLAGEVAVVYLRPTGGAGLELFVYDDLNNLICSSGAAGQGSECRWRPRRNGSYLIDIRNDTSSEVDYELAINREPVPR